jgi:hypothetical protein
VRHIPLLVVVASIATAGCNRKQSEDPPQATGDIFSEVVPFGTRPDCPADLTELGTPGEYGQASSRFEWGFDSFSRLSYSPMFYADTGADIISIALTVDGGSEEVGFITLQIGGVDWVNDDWGADPLYHFPAVTSTIALPMNNETFPTAGCVAVMAVSEEDLTDDGPATLHINTRRYEEGTGLLDLNLVIIDGTEIFQEELDAAIQVMRSLYTAGDGPTLGTVDVFSATHPSGSIIEEEGEDANILRAITAGDSDQAMNVYFISDFVEPGTLGFASGIPGVLGIEGTAGSGVIIAVDGHLNDDGSSLDTQMMGETIAHEAGHQIGLFHTTEEQGGEGGYDVISDTPQCPQSQDTDGDGSLNAEECIDFDGTNFMFWTSGDARQNAMSPIQSDVLYFSTIVQ